MKTVPIKFRGVSAKTGDYVYGAYVNECTFVCDGEGCDAFKFVCILPATAAQLVGYDSNGNEVYEGDVLVSTSGCKFVATLESFVQRVQKPPFKSYRRYLHDDDKMQFRLFKKADDNVSKP